MPSRGDAKRYPLTKQLRSVVPTQEDEDEEEEEQVDENVIKTKAKPKTKQTPKGKKASPATRHRKVPLDSINTISKASILRLAYKAGVKSIGAPMYEEARTVMRSFMESILKEAVLLAGHSRRKTVNKDDVVRACESKYKKVSVSGNEADTRRCKVLESKATHKRGELAMESIRFYQKQHGCFQISVKPFKRLVSEICHEAKAHVKVTSDAYGIMQALTEEYLIDAFNGANLAAAHADRKSIQPKDLDLVKRIKGM